MKTSENLPQIRGGGTQWIDVELRADFGFLFFRPGPLQRRLKFLPYGNIFAGFLVLETSGRRQGKVGLRECPYVLSEALVKARSLLKYSAICMNAQPMSCRINRSTAALSVNAIGSGEM